MTNVQEVKIDQLTPDEHNANAGTERGRYMLDHSLRQYGAGRSILVDKHGRVIAGNKTLEVAADIGLDDVIIVETDGHKLVAVKRTDLDLDDGDRARLLAYADNRSSEVGLAWDAEAIQFDLGAGLDLGEMFREEEIDVITNVVPGQDAWTEAFGALPDGDRAPFQQMTFILHDSQAEQVKAALTEAKAMGAFVDSPNENSNGNAIARICETFLTNGHG